MYGTKPPEAYRDLLLPRGSAGVIAAFEALTEAEVRSLALSILENPLFRWVLVDFQDQAIGNIKLGLSDPELRRQSFMLEAVESLLGAFIGKVFEPPEFPSD
jgi:hypothetical protein